MTNSKPHHERAQNTAGNTGQSQKNQNGLAIDRNVKRFYFSIGHENLCVFYKSQHSAKIDKNHQCLQMVYFGRVCDEILGKKSVEQGAPVIPRIPATHAAATTGIRLNTPEILCTSRVS